MNQCEEFVKNIITPSVITCKLKISKGYNAVKKYLNKNSQEHGHKKIYKFQMNFMTDAN